MKKKLLKYLPYYIGSKIEVNFFGMEDDVPTGERGRKIVVMDYRWLYSLLESFDTFQPKLFLRLLGGMTPDEYKEWWRIRRTNSSGIKRYEDDAACTRYLLTRGFDMFRLIENKIAFDVQELKAKNRKKKSSLVKN